MADKTVLEQSADKLKDAMPQLQELLSQARNQIKSLKPISEKNIVFKELNCVIQKFEDRVTVIFPVKDAAYNFYDKITFDSEYIKDLERNIKQLIEENVILKANQRRKLFSWFK